MDKLDELFPHPNPVQSLSYRQVLGEIEQNGEMPDEVVSILEWGPGWSTKYFLEHFPEATIHSIEHDKEWYDKAVQVFGKEKRVKLYWVPNSGNPGRNQGYVSYPLILNQYFQLALVDGRQRIDCAAIAAMVVDEDGIVLVHDYEARPNYKVIEYWFKEVRVSHNTAICFRSRLELLE